MDRKAVLDRYYLDCRCMLLELAATLDRCDRAPRAAGAADDGRLATLHEAIGILARPSAQPDRSARLLRMLSVPVE